MSGGFVPAGTFDNVAQYSSRNANEPAMRTSSSDHCFFAPWIPCGKVSIVPRIVGRSRTGSKSADATNSRRRMSSLTAGITRWRSPSDEDSPFALDRIEDCTRGVNQDQTQRFGSPDGLGALARINEVESLSSDESRTAA